MGSPTCYSQTRTSITVSVLTNSIPPSFATTSPAAICSGTPSTLSFTGGIAGTSATWNWFTSSCGGILAASGTNPAS